MKKLALLAGFLACFGARAQEQQPLKIFIDTNYKRVLKEDQAAMVAYVGKPSGSDLYRLVAYDKSGFKLINASFKDMSLKIRQGETLLYKYLVDEDGRIFGTQLSQKLTYDNNQLSGESIVYDGAQQVVSKANYKNGKLDGDYILYDSYGKVASAGRYQNGVKVGDWLMEAGKRIYTYKNGKVVEKNKAAPQR